MRLYLSSYRVGERAGSLLALLGGRRAVVIENGMDGVSSRLRQSLRQDGYDIREELRALGITPTLLDLRQYFGRPEGLRNALAGYDLVWVGGGNAFVLRRAMRQSGFDDVIVDLLEADAIVYAGAGAGAAVTAPGLDGLNLMYDAQQIPEGYAALPAGEGLGLIDQVIVPHYRSPHPQSAAAERVVRHLGARGLRHRALRDGEAIVWVENRRRQPEPERRIA